MNYSELSWSTASKPSSNISCTVPGVTAADAVDADPVPISFVAFTVNVYADPFDSPVTVHDNVDVEHVAPPGDAVTV